MAHTFFGKRKTDVAPLATRGCTGYRRCCLIKAGFEIKIQKLGQGWPTRRRSKRFVLVFRNVYATSQE